MAAKTIAGARSAGPSKAESSDFRPRVFMGEGKTRVTPSQTLGEAGKMR
jgi:hypothetical protein